jgi:hypothetical protein
LVSDAAGYRELRQLLTTPAGLSPITHAHAMPLVALREIRADQYGIRTQVQMDGQAIKLEIVREARITLEAPTADDTVCGVSTLTRLDLAASKLLANSDRQADDGVFSRDVIDLAMMELPLPVLRAALAKAEQAYGPSVARDLGKAIDRLQRTRRLAGTLHAGHGHATAQGGAVAKGTRLAPVGETCVMFLRGHERLVPTTLRKSWRFLSEPGFSC